MNTNKTYVVAHFGLTGYEIRVLQTICQLSKTRPRTYELQDVEATQPIDIAIVDQDDAEALSTWRHIQARNPLLPVITLAKHPVKNPSSHQLGRPLMATRLLKLLDEMKVSNERMAFDALEEVAFSALASEDKSTDVQRTSVDANGSLRTALVVDDSLPIRRQIELELAPFVGKVDVAENGEHALELVTRKTYDIVFLDVVLPGMDGYKICRQIKRDRKTKQTPVIMLTGKSSPFDRIKGKLAGCDTYLTKPVDHVTFESVVQKYLYKQKRELFGRNDGLALSVPEHA